uniref:Uncharacterized protein n=1 Tax=viral metagenome TaxID=1070528 RepID=A0A6C0BN25_9ZZZZ
MVKNRNERRKREKFSEIRALIQKYIHTPEMRPTITHRIANIQRSLWLYHGMDKDKVLRHVDKWLLKYFLLLTTQSVTSCTER